MCDSAVRLQRCFATLFPELPQGEIARASTNTIAEWDSVATVTLLSLIEEEFGVSLDFEHLEKLTSYDAILAHLQSRLSA